MPSLNDVLNALLDDQQIAQPELKSARKAQKERITIGVPKERYGDERRVALGPLSVEILVSAGLKIVVEESAGLAAGFPDCAYLEKGATIEPSVGKVFQCDIVLTVGHPGPSEIALMQENKLLITSVLSGKYGIDSINALVKRKVTAISREFTDYKSGDSPILSTLLPIEAKASVLMAAELLASSRGILLGGVAGIAPIEMVVFGASITAEYISQTAMVMGTSVKVFGRTPRELEKIKRQVGQSVHTSLMYPSKIKDALKMADVVIFTLDMRHHNQQFCVAEAMIEAMKEGTIIIDITANPPSWGRSKDHSKPDPYILRTYGVYYFATNNISSRVAHTASKALSDLHADFVRRLTKMSSLVVTLRNNRDLNEGVYMYRGIVVNQFVGKDANLPSQDLNLLLC